MDAEAKIDILGQAAQYDLCSVAGQPMPDGEPLRRDIMRHIAYVQPAAGRPMPVLKVLQTNACAKDCYYCPFRAGRRFRRAAFKPEELAHITVQLYRARLIQGLFLSSGVVGKDDYTMGQIVATAEILRRKHAFDGYLHLKIMPTASDSAIEAALRLANRVSVNLEAPNAERLAQLTSTKDIHHDLVMPLRRVKTLVEETGRRVSRTTQFVVGAAGESDREILSTAQRLYRELGLRRAYYSAFRPVHDTPLEGQPAENPLRQDRLYQADALLRLYNFSLGDIGLRRDGNLALDADPKLVWAQGHPEHFPVEVNTAPRSALLRVPGIGPVSADRLLMWRRQGSLRTLADLRKAGAAAERAAPFVILDGRRPPEQLTLWPQEA
jgi:predicted DNA-binding helix-hairpin-helix protein